MQIIITVEASSPRLSSCKNNKNNEKNNNDNSMTKNMIILRITATETVMRKIRTMIIPFVKLRRIIITK